MRLSTLLNLSGLDAALSSDPEVHEVSENSLDIEQGWVFVAVRGHSRDGHNFINDAIRRGASAVVSEQEVRVATPNIVVEDSRRVLADLAAAVNSFPSRSLRVYGITGTDGKTTTSYMLRSILQASGCKTGMLTTVETLAGGIPQAMTSRMTTPSAPHVQRALAAMVAGADRCCVLESSSHALAQDRLRNVTYRGAAITNIASDHIDFHGSHENYVDAKASLLTMVEDAPGPHIALNADDRDSMEIARRLGGPYISYGINSRAEVQGRFVEAKGDRVEFQLDSRGTAARVVLPVGGDYNVYNALAAAALATSEDIPIELIRQGLESARIPPGRLERIQSGQQFDVFVDYAHTEQALESVLRYLLGIAHGRGGRLLAVFGAAGDRDRSKRKNLARIAREHSDFFVITNEDPFNEDPDAIMTEIASGANPEERGSRWTIERDRRRALALAFDMAQRGDVVAVTGKGHEHAIAAGAESIPWNDAEVIKELLSEGARRGG